MVHTFKKTLVGVTLVGSLASCSLTTPSVEEQKNAPDAAKNPAESTPVATVSDQHAATENIPDVSFSSSGTVSYDSPAGKDEIGFDIVVEKGVIKSLAVTGKAPAEHKGSVWAQNNFIAAAQASIVGKPVNTLGVHAVGGASLTTDAFKQFLANAVEKNTKK